MCVSTVFYIMETKQNIYSIYLSVYHTTFMGQLRYMFIQLVNITENKKDMIWVMRRRANEGMHERCRVKLLLDTGLGSVVHFPPRALDLHRGETSVSKWYLGPTHLIDMYENCISEEFALQCFLSAFLWRLAPCH